MRWKKCFRGPKADTSLHCEITDTESKHLHRTLCLFTPQLLLVLTVPTTEGWPNWVGLGRRLPAALIHFTLKQQYHRKITWIVGNYPTYGGTNPSDGEAFSTDFGVVWWTVCYSIPHMWQYFLQNFSHNSIAYIYLTAKFLLCLFLCFFFMFICYQWWWIKMYIY